MMTDRDKDGGGTGRPAPISNDGLDENGTPSPTGFGSDSAPGQGSDLGAGPGDPLLGADDGTDSADLAGVGTQRGPGGSSRD